MSSYSVILVPKEKLDPYLALIYSRWLKSLRLGNDLFRLIDSKAYYTSYHRFITAVLASPETEVRLAVLSDDHDVVLGFSVSRGTVLDYVHVHKDQRKLGIGRSLVPKEIITITHVTKTGLTIWASKFGQWKFNPFA